MFAHRELGSGGGGLLTRLHRRMPNSPDYQFRFLPALAHNNIHKLMLWASFVGLTPNPPPAPHTFLVCQPTPSILLFLFTQIDVVFAVSVCDYFFPVSFLCGFCVYLCVRRLSIWRICCVRCRTSTVTRVWLFWTLKNATTSRTISTLPMYVYPFACCVRMCSGTNLPRSQRL